MRKKNNVQILFFYFKINMRNFQINIIPFILFYLINCVKIKKKRRKFKNDY